MRQKCFQARDFHSESALIAVSTRGRFQVGRFEVLGAPKNWGVCDVRAPRIPVTGLFRQAGILFADQSRVERDFVGIDIDSADFSANS